ncbi:MAG: DMT family transporter [Gaiellaceae bacterium]
MSASAERERGAYVPLALLATAVVIFGTGYWPTAVAAAHAPSLMVTMLRVVSSAVFLLALALALRTRLPRGHMLGWSVLTGLLIATVFQWGLTEAIERAGPGNGAVLINTNPLMVLVLAWIFLRERLPSLGVFGLLAGFGGVVLMVSSQLGGEVETHQLLLGSFLALVAALSYAVGVVILRSLSQREGEMDMLGIVTVQFLVGSAVLLPIALAVEGTAGTDWSSGSFWAATTWTGPGAAVAALLFYLALKRLPAAKTSSALFLVPAVAIVVEVVRGNTPDALALTGMLVTVLGVALAALPPEWAAALGRLSRRRTAG